MENIKNKHLARRHDFKRQTSASTATAVPIHNPEQKHFLNSLFTSTNSMGSSAIENNHHSNNNNNIYPPSSDHSSTFYSSPSFDHSQTPSLEEFLSPSASSPSTSFSSYPPNSSSSRHGFLNLSFDDPSSFINQHGDSSTYPY